MRQKYRFRKGDTVRLRTGGALAHCKKGDIVTLIEDESEYGGITFTYPGTPPWSRCGACRNEVTLVRKAAVANQQAHPTEQRTH